MATLNDGDRLRSAWRSARSCGVSRAVSVRVCLVVFGPRFFGAVLGFSVPRGGTDVNALPCDMGVPSGQVVIMVVSFMGLQEVRA